MSIFNKNIDGAPRVTAQVIRDFQNSIDILPDDSPEVMCDKLSMYIFYWVHAQLLDYQSFKISLRKVNGGSEENITVFGTDGTYQWNPRIQKFIDGMEERGFNISTDIYGKDIIISW